MTIVRPQGGHSHHNPVSEGNRCAAPMDATTQSACGAIHSTVARAASNNVGTMTQAGEIGTCQWFMAHQTTAHFTRITIHAAPRNQRIRTD